MKLAIRQLIDNALKYSSPPAPVEISTRNVLGALPSMWSPILRLGEHALACRDRFEPVQRGQRGVVETLGSLSRGRVEPVT